MKAILSFLLLPVIFLRVGVPTACADELLLIGNHTLVGTVLQTNDDHILLLTDYGTRSILQGIVEKVIIDSTSPIERDGTKRLPSSKNALIFLSKQPWATNLKQIPATVIDTGILKKVPYISFRCGEDYEINIYGDLDDPAGIEIGVYRKLTEDFQAKTNCVAFASEVLGRSSDRAVIQSLNLQKDIRNIDGLTFEITPPSAEDSYGGWWVSIYSEEKLRLARASDQDLKNITEPISGTTATEPISGTTATGPISGSTATRPASAGTVGHTTAAPRSWSKDELKLARPSSHYPSTITFRDKSGQIHSNVMLVRVIQGVSLIWRDGASGGLVKLADLPEEQRAQFGYDPAKAAAAEIEEKRKSEQLDRASAALSEGSQGQYEDVAPQSTGGSVFVHGYVRSNGTYVNSYTRSR